MHEAALAAAALPAPAFVLGMELRPYSIGHEIFLIRESNPLALYGESSRHGGSVPVLPSSAPARPSDIRPSLAQAVLICCQSFEESRRICREWFAPLKLSLWRRRVAKLDTSTELVKFREYQLFGSLDFKHSSVVKPGQTISRTPGSPFLLRLYQFLITHLQETPQSAWDYPLGLAKMQWQAYWESEGGLDIENETEQEFEKWVEEMEAKNA
jgi:hypothetical protein